MAEQNGQVNPLFPAAQLGAPPSSPRPSSHPYREKLANLASVAQRMATNPIFDQIPSGDNPEAYDRMRAMMSGVKDLSKSTDTVLNELARVGNVELGEQAWDGIKDDLHSDIRERAAEMRSELRRQGNVSYLSHSPHMAVNGEIQKFADAMREMATDHAADWITRAKGDEADLHPDDLDVLADHAEHVHGAFGKLVQHLSNSHHADYRTYELVRNEKGDLVHQPYPNGETRMREHPVSIGDGVHGALRDRAQEVREEIGEENG